MNLKSEEPLFIQAMYARRLEAFCCCKLFANEVVDQDDRPIDVKKKPVLLRASCESAQGAINILETYGAILFENTQSMKLVEHWDALSLSKRKIYSVELGQILDALYPKEVLDFLSATPHVFIKTRTKGFCARVRAEQLLQKNVSVLDFFKVRCIDQASELMFSEFKEVKSDSLGLRESRHFVFNGNILNSSRNIRSLKHTVPKKQRDKAEEYVKEISGQRWFPQNYVLDIGEFEYNGTTCMDVIELNPITTSLCYVNNSIFTEMTPEAMKMYAKLGMGIEFCFDAIANSQRYQQNRYTGVSYSYYSDTQYDLTKVN